MKQRLWVFIIVAAMALSVGCSGGNNNGGSGGSPTIFTPNIDLAVYDRNFEGLTAFDTNSTLLLYFNVLNNTDGGKQNPSVILDSTSTGMDQPRFPLFAGNDLYLGDRGGAIHIYRSYQSLSDGAAPDVTLDDDGGGAGTIGAIQAIAFGNDTLFGADRNNSEVYIFANASAIAANQAPDATLSTSVSSPDGLYYDESNDKLYLAQNTTTSGEACVGRYDGASTIVADQAPDAQLTTDVSFAFNNNFNGPCRDVFVDETNDRLFVTVDDQDHSDSQQESAIYQFENASSFATDDLPSAVILFDGTHTLAPNKMQIFNGRLWVATKNSYDDDYCQVGAGVEAYELDDTVGLVVGQDPSVFLTGDSSHTLSRSQSIVSVGGFLFVQNFEGCDDYSGLGDFFVYNTQAGGPTSSDQPFLFFPAGLNFGTATAVAANLVDSGT